MEGVFETLLGNRKTALRSESDYEQRESDWSDVTLQAELYLLL